MIKFISSAQWDKEASIILCVQEELQQGSLKNLPAQIKQSIIDLKKSKQFAAAKNEIYPLFANKRIFLLVGLGSQKEMTLPGLRGIVRNAALSPYLKHHAHILVVPHVQNALQQQAILEGILIGTYSWKKYRTTLEQGTNLEDRVYYLICGQKRDYQETVTICEGVNFTRDLINDNADVTTSDFLEKTVRELIHGHKNIELEILNKKELKEKGLNLHLAVNQGSNKEPKLIIVHYKGDPKKKFTTAILGKGITFDSGGLNLKTSGHIETMRSDMSGAAAVCGVLKNILALKVRSNLILALGLAENAIGPAAYKPGDVITSYSGKTVEIGNTDAEGRLVLADDLSYIIKNYQPDRILDIATLTGACVVALGYDYSGLITPDDDLAEKLLRAAQETDDRLWRLPSYPELIEAMKSEIADIKNISNQRGAGGTITAGEFLRQFVHDSSWAHLDIAGTAYAERPRAYYSYGATGAGVRLLTEFLIKNK